MAHRLIKPFGARSTSLLDGFLTILGNIRPVGRPRSKWLDQIRSDNLPPADLRRCAIRPCHSGVTQWSQQLDYTITTVTPAMAPALGVLTTVLKVNFGLLVFVWSSSNARSQKWCGTETVDDCKRNVLMDVNNMACGQQNFAKTKSLSYLLRLPASMY